MALTPPGWFDDGSGQLRYWNGSDWTEYFFDSKTGAVVNRDPAADGPVAVLTPKTSQASGANIRAAVITGSVLVIAIIAFAWPAALLFSTGIAAGTVGLYALLKGSLSRLRIRTRSVAATVLVAGILASSLGGAALAAPAGRDRSDPSAEASQEASPSPTPTSTPTPTPVRQESIIEERAAIPYTSGTIDDPNLDVGSTSLSTVGTDGEKITRIRVVTVDGVEISREVIEEVVAVQPINEVIAVGSRQPPPPPPPAPENGGCDPNYEGACVPISSDVDCAGGSGNGPDYVDGPVWIVGSDVYDLDRDGDGIRV
jgi:resuscitation-promoting factor RpfB